MSVAEMVKLLPLTVVMVLGTVRGPVTCPTVSAQREGGFRAVVPAHTVVMDPPGMGAALATPPPAVKTTVIVIATTARPTRNRDIPTSLRLPLWGDVRVRARDRYRGLGGGGECGRSSNRDEDCHAEPGLSFPRDAAPHPLIGPDAGFPHGRGAESTLGLPTEMSIQRDRVETCRPLVRSRTAAPASSPRRCGSRSAPRSRADPWRGARGRVAISRSSRSSARAPRGEEASRAPVRAASVSLPGDQRFVVLERFERHVRGETLFGMRDDEVRTRFRPDELGELAPVHAPEARVETAPARDAVDVDRHLGLRQRLKLLVGEGHRGLHLAEDLEVPRRESVFGPLPACRTGHFSVRYWPGGRRAGAPRSSRQAPACQVAAWT